MTGRAYCRHQLNLLDYALAGMWRRRLRNGAILLVFTLLLFLLSSIVLLSRSLIEAATLGLAQAPAITVQQLVAGRQQGIGLEHRQTIKSLRGVRQVVPRVWGYYFDEANGANYTILAVADQDDSQPPQLPLAWGRMPSAPGEVVVSDLVLKALQLGERRNVSFFRPDLSQASFTVVGQFAETTTLVAADLILMTPADARDLFAIPAQEATDLLVQVANPREIETVAGKILATIPGTRVITREQIAKTYQVVFNYRSGFALACLVGALAAFVILVYDKASGLSREDRYEAAVLKLIGWSSSDIMQVRFYESLCIALLAFVLGYGLAWVHLVWGEGWLFGPLLLGWSVLRPPLAVIPAFAGDELLVILAISVLPYLVATIVPAWRSASIRPDEMEHL